MLPGLSVFSFLFVNCCLYPLHLTFNLFLTISITFDFAPVFCCVGEFVFVRLLGMCGFSSFFLVDTSSSDLHFKSCITSVASGGFVRFFRFKHSCVAFSQLRLLGELLVATFYKGVFRLRPKSDSNSEVFVTQCDGIFNVLKNFGYIWRELVRCVCLNNFITANLRFKVCIILSANPIAL